jgi:hypothetical protein
MSLPPLLDGWMREALGAPLPAEGRAPCHACPQCASTEALPTALATFDPSTKCCTYLPLLRCFQVGFILADDDSAVAAGRATVQARIDARMAVTPLGLLWPASFARAYDEGQEDRFGRRRDLRCPHYLADQGGQCGVWRHRNATCSTWFCRYERGDLGRTYWRALYALLDHAEDALMWWCVDRLDVGAEARALLASGDGPRGRLDGDAPIDDAAYAAVWGRWAGREAAFYLAAAELVRPLRWGEIAEIGGARLAALREEVDLAGEDLRPTRLPPFLSAGAWRDGVDDGAARWIYGYRAYDPVAVPTEAVPVLAAAAGWTPAELTERLTHVGVAVDEPTLRAWVDRGVLRAALPS